MLNEPSEQPSKQLQQQPTPARRAWPVRSLRALGRGLWRFVRSGYTQAALIIAALLVGFFARTLFTDKLNSPADILQLEPTLQLQPGQEVTPQNPLSGDAIIQFEPWYEFARRSLDQGEFPWWNPYQGNGVPHVANSQSALFYPLTWFVLLLGFKWGLLLLMASKLFLIGFFTYCYLREIRLNHWAALFGGAAFMFAGANMVWLYWPIPTVMFFLPLGLWLIERACNRPYQIRTYLGFALAVAAGFLAGHVQTFVHIALVIAVYALLLLTSRVVRGIKKIGWRATLRRYCWVALWLTGAGLVGIALTGVQLLPFVEYLQNSFELIARSSLTHNPYWLLARYIGLNLVPDLLGNQAWPQSPGFVASTTTNYNDATSGYVGLVVLASAIAAFVTHRRSLRVWLLLAVAVGALGLVYHAPVWFEAMTRIPYLDTANHIRLLFLVAFVLCVLSAHFWSALIKRQASVTARWLGPTLTLFLLGAAAVATVLLGFEHVRGSAIEVDYDTYVRWLLLFIGADAVLMLLVFALTRWWPVAMALGALVMLAETGLHGLWYQPATSPTLHYPVTRLVTFLQQKAPINRVVSISSTAHLWPNLGMYYGFADPRVYDSLGVANHRLTLSTYLASLGNSQGITAAQARYLDAIGVQYILARDEYELTTILGLRPDELRYFKPVVRNPQFILYQNLRALPRFFVATDKNFFDQPQKLDSATTVTLESYTNNSLSLHVSDSTSPNRTLIVTDTYYPGWRAYVDGVPTSIKQADLNARAVTLPPGEHQVIMRYEPDSVRYGKTLSLAGVLLVLAVPVVVFVWRRRL